MLRKSQKRFLLVMIILCVGIIAAYNWKPKRVGNNYTFQKDDSTEAIDALYMSSWVYGSQMLELETAAQFRGALLALFGAPLWESEDFEDAYQYMIRAVAEDGTTYYLSVYQGPSGPAVGGDPDLSGIEDAAAALCEILMTSEPADFEREMYYADTHSRILYGCKNGKPFVEETVEEMFL